MSTLVLHFYFKEIVNYEFSNSDLFSYKLIDWYKEVVFLLSYDLASDLDTAIYLYISDISFKKKLSRIIKIKDINMDNDKLVSKIISYKNDYINMRSLEQVNSRWL